MKKSIARKLFFRLAAIALSFSLQTHACSLMAVSDSDVKDNMIGALATKLNLNTSEISEYDLTTPQLVFLQPLGADCSGLKSAFRVSSYHMEKKYSHGTCTHRGSIILRGYGLQNKVDVYDESSCLGNPVYIESLPGTWLNEDAQTRGITKVIFSRDGKNVRVFGKCHPTDCKWGKARVKKLSETEYRTTYRFRNMVKKLKFTLTDQGGLSIEQEVERNGALIRTSTSSFRKR